MARTTPQIIHAVQPGQELCWATCIKMVLEVKRAIALPDITPQGIADRILYASMIDEGVYERVIKAGLEAYGVGGVITMAQVLWGAVKAQIDNNRPLIVGVEWKVAGKHVMVVGGYEEAPKNMNWIYLHDPLRKAEKKIFFDAFVSGRYAPDKDTDVDRGNCNWIMTITTVW